MSDPGLLSRLWPVLALAALVVVASVLSALIERSGPFRLQRWAEKAGGRIWRLHQHRHGFEVFRTLLSLLAKLMPLALVLALGRLLANGDAHRPYLWATAGVIALVGVTELLNRFLVEGAAEEALGRLTRVFRIVLVIATPLIPLLRPLVPTRGLKGDEDEDEEEATDEEVEAFIELGTKEGIFEPEEGEMVLSIVDFGDTEVKVVMTPRIDVAAAPAEEGIDELARRFLDSGHSRLPVFSDSIDKIVGIVHLRDVLRAVSAGRKGPGGALAQSPYFIPETKPLDELLKEMQVGHHQMAVVVDEYGGTAGVVTVEDLLEEIVGEIADEHEIDEQESEELADGGWRFDGGVQLEVLEERFGVEDGEEAPFKTLGGMIFSVLGHVPEEGEAIDWHGLRLTVERVADRRVRTVRVDRIAEPGEGEPAVGEPAAGEETAGSGETSDGS